MMHIQGFTAWVLRSNCLFICTSHSDPITGSATGMGAVTLVVRQSASCYSEDGLRVVRDILVAFGVCISCMPVLRGIFEVQT